MAFRAKTINGKLFAKHPQTDKPFSKYEPGPGPTIEVDGVTFGPNFPAVPYAGTWDEKLGFGVPTPAQLEHDQLHIETMEGEAWPGSAIDRAGKREGKDRMQLKALRGEWPGEKERALQRNAHARIKNPAEFVRRIGKVRGLKPAEIDLRVAMAEGTAHAVEVPDLGYSPDDLRPENLGATAKKRAAAGG